MRQHNNTRHKILFIIRFVFRPPSTKAIFFSLVIIMFINHSIIQSVIVALVMLNIHCSLSIAHTRLVQFLLLLLLLIESDGHVHKKGPPVCIRKPN